MIWSLDVGLFYLCRGFGLRTTAADDPSVRHPSRAWACKTRFSSHNGEFRPCRKVVGTLSKRDKHHQNENGIGCKAISQTILRLEKLHICEMQPFGVPILHEFNCFLKASERKWKDTVRIFPMYTLPTLTLRRSTTT